MNKKLNLSVVIGFLIITMSAVARAETFYANLQGVQQVPPVSTAGTGYARVVVNESTMTLNFIVVFNNLSSNQTAAHIHAPAPLGATAPVSINFGAVGGTSGTITGTNVPITALQLSQIRAHQGYVNVHSGNFGGGEIRGQLGIKRPVDYDGDGRQDISVWRFPLNVPPSVSQITVYNLNSTAGAYAADWGDANTDFPTPGDYDGDGLDDLALYRSSTSTGADSFFFIYRSSDNTADVIRYGIAEDQVVSRDYDGDGITDPAVYRRGANPGDQSFWYIRQSSTGGTDRSEPFGATGVGFNDNDTPIPGDYDGDGKFDLAVYRRGSLMPTNTFIVQRSSDAVVTYREYGDFTTDFIAPGDYDGDGKYDMCVVRKGLSSSSPLVWYIHQSSNDQDRAETYGRTDDVLVQGDYDGDARTDIAVYRRGATSADQSNFYVLESLTNASVTTPWGLRADFPVASFDAR